MYLPIRAFNRSQSVRIGKQKVTSTATTYVDLSDAKQKKELSYHSAIGAVYVVGPLTATDETTVVVNGGQVTWNEALKVDVSVGTLRNRDTGATVDIDSASKLALSAAHATLDRIDIVEVKVADGTVKKKDGTAAASPVAATPDTGYIALAEIEVEAEATAITQAEITDLRNFA